MDIQATDQPPSVVGQYSLTSAALFPNLYHPKKLIPPEPKTDKEPKTDEVISVPTDIPKGEDVMNGTNMNENREGRRKYADLIKPPSLKMIIKGKESQAPVIPMKQLTYNDGIPRVTWTEEEVFNMNILEELQYAIVGKFSYGWPELDELRTQIPKQCHIKGECKIGLLWNRHILIRLSHMEDFVNLLSKSAYYIASKDGNSYQMRPLIYDTRFKPDEETTQAMAWISFPDLLPTFFVKESIFSIAAGVGKPIHLDMATINC
ncbi:hypothetical protein FXO37_00637 [Capsicum annuum]|nr:hypothetical protein FXO37_00637 [Capsicum annuum]